MTVRRVLAALAAIAVLTGAARVTNPGHPETQSSSAPEASFDARAPWLSAPRQADVSETRFNNALAAVARSSPSIVFIGDSITENWLTVGRAIWDSDYAPRGAMNLGFGGDRTENTLWRIEQGELDGIAPKTAIVEIGTNDLNRWSVGEVAIGIEAVVTSIHSKLPETQIVLLGILPRDGTPIAPMRRRAAAVNNILSTMSLGPHVRYENIGEVLLAANGTLLPSVMYDKNLHPSQDGYARLAPEIDRILTSL